jgi:hypothetical protein
MTDMQTIQQEGLTSTRNVSLATKNRDFFDDYNTSGFSSRSKYEFQSFPKRISFDLFYSQDIPSSVDDDSYRKY